jgi:hypothetical protein
MESANLINYSTDMCWSCPYTTVQAMYLTKQEVMKLGDGYGCWAVYGEGDSRVMGFYCRLPFDKENSSINRTQVDFAEHCLML